MVGGMGHCIYSSLYEEGVGGLKRGGGAPQPGGFWGFSCLSGAPSDRTGGGDVGREYGGGKWVTDIKNTCV